jgi:hypothetical protein
MDYLVMVNMDKFEEAIKEIVNSFYGREDAYGTVSFNEFVSDLHDAWYPNGCITENREQRRHKNKY